MPTVIAFEIQSIHQSIVEDHHRIMDYVGGTNEADHLCVLVHGLWGNPTHMRSIAEYLRDKFPADKLHLLVAKANTGSFTYDGIDRGGERVCAEIEAEVQRIHEAGGKIRKFSMIGYSLGGLVIRYAVGLLHAKGFLDTVECLNFTTFASPHLGVRTPAKGFHNHLWNILGARILSISGRQLFTIDNFRSTGRPLLSILADPSTIFVSGLKRFKNRSLYTNIVNDRTAVHYTTGISRTDPYRNLDRISPRFEPGYKPVILEHMQPLNPTPAVPPHQTPWQRIVAVGRSLPLYIAISIIIPIAVVVFLLSSVIQTICSSRRIRLHELGLAGIAIDKYRPPLWIQEVRAEVEQVYEALNSTQGEDLGDTDTEGDIEGNGPKVNEERKGPDVPTLALTPAQFSMIDSMDEVGWKKYPVWIHDDRHTHAAIIVRYHKKTSKQGKVVLRHFVEHFET